MSRFLLSRFSRRTDTHPVGWTTTWPELVQELTRFEFRESKDGPLWSPAEYRPGATRGSRSVARVHVLAFDLDSVTEDQALDVLHGLRGLSHAYHTTWSHPERLPAGLGCYRVFVRLSRPVEPAEWRAFWAAAVATYGRGMVDPATKDLARVFYTPSAPRGTEEHADAGSFPGEPLDVDALLAAGDKTPKARPVDVPSRTWAEVQGYTPTEAAKGASREWLRSRCESLTKTPLGEPIHAALNSLAFEVGCRVPHVLSRSEARAFLMDALRERRPDMATAFDSRHGATFEEKYERVIEDAFRDAHTKGEPFLPESNRFQLTEWGITKRVLEDVGADIRYVPAWGKWFVWVGTHWYEDIGAHVVTRLFLATLKRLAEVLRADPDKDFAGPAETLLRGYQSVRVQRLISLAPESPVVRVAPDYFDRDPWLLNVANGTVDLRTGLLRPHTQEDGITRVGPVPYDPRATAPRWARFLSECMAGDTDMVDYLQRAVGYSLSGSVQKHCLFFLHGSGRNGKTTFINTLLQVVGGNMPGRAGYATRGVPELLLASRYAGHPTEKAVLYGARICVVPEVEENRAWSETTLKDLTGGELITARRMREDFWVFAPTHKFWISGNSKPRVRGTDDGIWSRLKLIPFTVSFAGREDESLSETLAAELPGILAWGVAGAQKFRETGLRDTVAMLAAADEYRQDEDLLGQFVRDRLEVTENPEDFMTRTQVRRLYDAWVHEQGAELERLSAKAFVGALRRLGLTERQSGGERGWGCVKVRAGEGAAGLFTN